jgi:hypothetical protein
MIVCAVCDFASALVFITALFVLKPEKKKKSG